MLAMVCLVCFACGTKYGDSTANVSNIDNSATFAKANEIAETAKEELELGESKDKDLTKAINAEKRDIYYIWRADAYRMLGNDKLADADIKEAEKLSKNF